MAPAFLDAQQRTTSGRKVGALRRSNITPVHVYGRGMDSLSLQANSAELASALGEVGRTTPLTVRVDGDEHFVMVREVQRHPVTEQVLHVDLLRVSRTERLRAAVPVVLEGEAPGARAEGAMLVQDLHSLEVEALPMDLPSHVTIDLSVLEAVDMGIYARDVELPPEVSLTTDPDAPVVRVVFHRAAVEEEAVAEEVEGEAVPAAEAQPAADQKAPETQ